RRQERADAGDDAQKREAAERREVGGHRRLKRLGAAELAAGPQLDAAPDPGLVQQVLGWAVLVHPPMVPHPAFAGRCSVPAVLVVLVVLWVLLYSGRRSPRRAARGRRRVAASSSSWTSSGGGFRRPGRSVIRM